MDGIKVYISVFVSFISLAIGQTTADIGLNTCRMQLSCGDEIPANAEGSRPVGIAGKRGPPGLKGAKGDPCDCGGKLSDIENRLDALETPKCPQTKFIFANEKQTSDWIKVKEPIQQIDGATVCSWLSANGESTPATGAWLSYSTMSQANELLLYFGKKTIDIQLKGSSQSATMTIMPNNPKIHVCVVISRSKAFAKVFLNGALYKSLSYDNSDAIAGGGSMLIGQEQDAFFGGFVSAEAFSGTVENFMMWYRVLNDREITTLYNDECSCPAGYSIALTVDQIQFGGNVITLPTEQC